MIYKNYSTGDDLDVREEHGYRRGFDQGMYIVIAMIELGYPIEKIKDIKNKVHAWRYSTKGRKHGNPNFYPPVDFNKICIGVKNDKK